jgi:hypothetical protein
MSSTYIQVFLSEVIVNVVNSELGALGLPIVHKVRELAIVDRRDSLVGGFAAATRSRSSAIVWIAVKMAPWAGEGFQELLFSSNRSWTHSLCTISKREE